MPKTCSIGRLRFWLLAICVATAGLFSLARPSLAQTPSSSQTQRVELAVALSNAVISMEMSSPLSGSGSLASPFITRNQNVVLNVQLVGKGHFILEDKDGNLLATYDKLTDDLEDLVFPVTLGLIGNYNFTGTYFEDNLLLRTYNQRQVFIHFEATPIPPIPTPTPAPSPTPTPAPDTGGSNDPAPDDTPSDPTSDDTSSDFRRPASSLLATDATPPSSDSNPPDSPDPEVLGAMTYVAGYALPTAGILFWLGVSTALFVIIFFLRRTRIVFLTIDLPFSGRGSFEDPFIVRSKKIAFNVRLMGKGHLVIKDARGKVIIAHDKLTNGKEDLLFKTTLDKATHHNFTGVYSALNHPSRPASSRIYNQKRLFVKF